MAPETKEVVIPLDSKKQITVKRFNNKALVDIREFYIDKEKNKKPGKKGIALTEELWKKLIEAKDEVEAGLRQMEAYKVEVLQSDGEEEKSNDAPLTKKRNIEKKEE